LSGLGCDKRTSGVDLALESMMAWGASENAGTKAGWAFWVNKAIGVGSRLTLCALLDGIFRRIIGARRA
jgi:hypothetical protein